MSLEAKPGAPLTLEMKRELTLRGRTLAAAGAVLITTLNESSARVVSIHAPNVKIVRFPSEEGVQIKPTETNRERSKT
jgi:hypothetical protein